MFLSVAAFSILLNVFCLIASMDLFLGVAWARWTMCVPCFFELLSAYAFFRFKETAFNFRPNCFYFGPRFSCAYILA